MLASGPRLSQPAVYATPGGAMPLAIAKVLSGHCTRLEATTSQGCGPCVELKRALAGDEDEGPARQNPPNAKSLRASTKVLCWRLT